MAIDPNANPMQPGGGFLAPLATPISTPYQSTTPLAPKPILTPEQIAALRQQAMAMQEPPKEGVKSWTQGVAELLRAIQGNRNASYAMEQESANREAQSKALMGMLPQTSSTATPSAAPPANNGQVSSSGQSTPVAQDTGGKEPRGIRNNNPLNIEDGPFARSQPGYVGSDGRFAKFDKPESGFGAANGLLDNYQKNGLNTVSGIISKWAPASDNNDVSAYVNNVSKHMGVDPNTPLTPAMRNQLLAAMAQHENGVSFNAGGAQPQATPVTKLAYAGPGNPPLAGPAPSPVTQGAQGTPTPPALATQNAPMLSAIAGRPMPSSQPPAVAGGALNPATSPQIAQNGTPSGGLPSPTGGQGLPSGVQAPLVGPHANLDQLRATINDPRVPFETKMMAVQQIQQLSQPQDIKQPGGNIRYIPATGQYQFIPEEVPSKTKVGTTEFENRNVYNPTTQQYEAKPLGVGGATGLGTTVPELQANEVTQAAAKKGAEENASAQAKTYNTIHTGISGDAINAARQAPVIDTLTKIAPAAFTGTGSDAALALNRMAAQFGIDPKGAAPRELFNMLSAKILGDQFAGIRNMAQEEGSPGGRVFKSMLDVEEKANITPEDTLEGTLAKLNYFKAMGQKVNDWADKADAYEQQHGKLDAGFMKDLRKDMSSSEFPTLVTGSNKGGTSIASAPTTFVGRTATNKTTGAKMRETAPNVWEPIK